MLLFVFFPFPSEIYIGSSFTETPVEKTMFFFSIIACKPILVGNQNVIKNMKIDNR